MRWPVPEPSLAGDGSLLAVASVTYVCPKAQPGTTVLVALAQHGRTLPGIAQAGDGVSEVPAVGAASFMLELNGASPCSAGPSPVPRAAGGARPPGPSAALASKPTGRKECALVARVALYVFGHEVFAVSTDRPSRSEPERQLLDAELELADDLVCVPETRPTTVTCRESPPGMIRLVALRLTYLIVTQIVSWLVLLARSTVDKDLSSSSCATKSPS